MAEHATPEPQAQRFDFGLSEVADPSRERVRRVRVPSATRAASAVVEDDDHVAEALRRRLDEVVAVAHRERSARRGSEAAYGAAPSDVRVGVARLGITVSDPDRREPSPATDRGDLVRLDALSRLDDTEDLGDDEAQPQESLTVQQFYDRVKQALLHAFPDEVWVTGEIRGLRESRGHRYIELADEGAETAGRAAARQLEVVCWSREWGPVAAALMEAGVKLEVGRVVRVRGRVAVWEGGSKLRFTLTALDVEALLGGIAAARRRLLLLLEREGLLRANQRHKLPLVPLRIGVVTSQGSEAHRDFVGQLARSGFAFDVRVAPSLVQGSEARRQIAAALARLVAFRPDLVVVVRGGGARGDLAVFDSEEVARAIATAPFPIWTGIGHTGDRSVADEVAQRALITPTACGEAVVGLVADYWESTRRRATTLSGLARARLDGAAQRLHGSAGAITRGTRHQLERRSDELVAARTASVRAVRSRIDRESSSLRAAAVGLAQAGRRATIAPAQESRRHQQVLRAYDPGRQLARGWSLTREASGRLVRSASQLGPGSEITTRLADGVVLSSVTAVDPVTPTGGPDDRVERVAGAG